MGYYDHFCEWCGRTFTSDRKKDKYCCHECKADAQHFQNEIRHERKVYEAIEEFRHEQEWRIGK